MAEEQKYLDMLALREIKPTALRLMILRTMLGSGCAMSLLDITDALVTVDKSTVSRTLALFLEHHLIHCEAFLSRSCISLRILFWKA